LALKKICFMLSVLCLIFIACAIPGFPPIAASLVPTSEADRQATAALIAEQTLQALPSHTVAPSNTAVISTATSTPTQPTPTETQNPILLTLTATLGTGTVIVGTPATEAPGTITVTPNPAFNSTPSETLHPQHYGTMPPGLPFGQIMLINNSKAEVYISLQCTTKDGYVTIIEYPVVRKIEINAPAGRYVYVAWVGGNKIVGKFGLDKFQDLTLIIYKDRVEIK
jgi:hypothetical protein